MGSAGDTREPLCLPACTHLFTSSLKVALAPLSHREGGRDGGRSLLPGSQEVHLLLSRGKEKKERKKHPQQQVYPLKLTRESE